MHESILISGPTIHPLTDFLFLSPFLLALYPVAPGERRSLILLMVKIPCFIANPSLSNPPVILNTYPLNYSPRLSASTSWPILFSRKCLQALESSMAMLLVVPCYGQCKLNWVKMINYFHTRLSTNKWFIKYWLK